MTHWSDEPVDVEALAPAGGGEVWVGDIGDNRGRPRGRSASWGGCPSTAATPTSTPTSYELRFPGGARDAESLLADPASGRLYVVSKGVLGGTMYAAPRATVADASPTG